MPAAFAVNRRCVAEPWSCAAGFTVAVALRIVALGASNIDPKLHAGGTMTFYCRREKYL